MTAPTRSRLILLPISRLSKPTLTSWTSSGCSNDFVPTEMDVDAGPIVRGLVWATLSGRSPLYRVAACGAHQDTA